MKTATTTMHYTCEICARRLNVKNSVVQDEDNLGVFSVEVAVEPCPDCVMRTDHYLKAVKKQMDGGQHD